MPLNGRYNGQSADSERIKEWLAQEDSWHLTWNESRYRLAGPPPFATFASKKDDSAASLATSYASSLRSTRSLGDLNDPIHGKPIATIEDGRSWA
jgi:hypothetical protein